MRLRQIRHGSLRLFAGRRPVYGPVYPRIFLDLMISLFVPASRRCHVCGASFQKKVYYRSFRTGADRHTFQVVLSHFACPNNVVRSVKVRVIMSLTADFFLCLSVFLFGGITMSLLGLLCDEQCWKKYYGYKSSLAVRSAFIKELGKYIENKDYLPVCLRIYQNEPFPLPSRSEINKSSSKKKRVVYMYPKKENTVLKLLTHLVLRKYDGLFCGGLYSFRPNRNAKDAVKHFTRLPDIDKMYYYKADISNYFNSIPVDKLVPLLNEALSDDPALCSFLCRLLEEPFVLDGRQTLREQKGIMAGTPISSFYANLYLKDLDGIFEEKGALYARYSDDIIVFDKDPERVREYRDLIHRVLHEKGLRINPDKESFGSPETGWCFLGFSYKKGVIDIAPVTLSKIKAKMRRKARALRRWCIRNDIEPEKAASAFIRIFNRKLLECPENSELSWSYWFFSVINTSGSLKVIDRYAQECIRFIISGRRTKARFNVRYGDLKALGYKSMVHEYYSYKKTETAPH